MRIYRLYGQCKPRLFFFKYEISNLTRPHAHTNAYIRSQRKPGKCAVFLTFAYVCAMSVIYVTYV